MWQSTTRAFYAGGVIRCVHIPSSSEQLFYDNNNNNRMPREEKIQHTNGVQLAFVVWKGRCYYWFNWSLWRVQYLAIGVCRNETYLHKISKRVRSIYINDEIKMFASCDMKMPLNSMSISWIPPSVSRSKRHLRYRRLFSGSSKAWQLLRSFEFCHTDIHTLSIDVNTYRYGLFNDTVKLFICFYLW